MTKGEIADRHTNPDKGPAFRMARNAQIPWLTADYSASTLTISPEDAAFILDGHNQTNRKMDLRRVDQWRRAIERGDWALNGTTISFDRNLELVDGQHRLKACVDSGKSIRVIVVTGLSPETSRHTVDVGKPRSTGDVLEISGMGDGIMVCAVTRALHRIRKCHREGTDTHDRYNESADMQDAAHVKRSAMSEIALIRDALSVVRGINTKWIAASSAAALHVEFAYQASADAATGFWVAVKTGASLEASDPRLLLRNRLQESGDARRTGRVAPGGGLTLNRTDLKERLSIHAWNRWISGNVGVRRGDGYILQMSRLDHNKESPYPTILGPVMS